MIGNLNLELTKQIKDNQAFRTIDYPLSAYSVNLTEAAFESLKVENKKTEQQGQMQVNMYIAMGYEISHLKEIVVNTTDYVVIHQIVVLRRYDPV